MQYFVLTVQPLQEVKVAEMFRERGLDPIVPLEWFHRRMSAKSKELKVFSKPRLPRYIITGFGDSIENHWAWLSSLRDVHDRRLVHKVLGMQFSACPLPPLVVTAVKSLHIEAPEAPKTGREWKPGELVEIGEGHPLAGKRVKIISLNRNMKAIRTVQNFLGALREIEIPVKHLKQEVA